MRAAARPNPDMSLLLEDTRRDTRTASLQLNPPIELGGKRGARIDAATRTGDAAEADLTSLRAEIRTTVTTAFFNVLGAQQRRHLADASVELAQRGATAAARRVVARKASPVEESKARVAEATVRLERQQAISKLNNARRRVALQ